MFPNAVCTPCCDIVVLLDVMLRFAVKQTRRQLRKKDLGSDVASETLRGPTSPTLSLLHLERFPSEQTRMAFVVACSNVQ
jgi:hypothetical protein